MILKTCLTAALALLAAIPARSQAVPLAADKANCIFTVTPSSTSSTQLNSTTLLTGTNCSSDYRQVCMVLNDTSTQVVFVSTFSTSVAPAGTITSTNVWPILGGVPGYCFDWFRNVAIYAHMKAGQTPVSNTLSVMFSR